MKKPLVLCILDGCGIREEEFGNAFKNANKPTFNYLWNNYPHSLLEASGTFVGLPKGQMGNSEVGHMNIGAGRVVYQSLLMINKKIEDNSFFENEEILKTINHVKINNSKLHLIGLLSDGGAHSHIDHLFALLKMAKENGIKDVLVHAITDGRDTDPKSGISFVEKLESYMKELGIGKIATVAGRFYTMDRDNNYDRIKKAYDAMCFGVGEKFSNAKDAINDSYNKDITDEYVVPKVIDDKTIDSNDGVIVFNFRPDRIRQIILSLTKPNEIDFETKTLENLKVISMLPVSNEINIPYAFNHEILTGTLGEYLSQKGLNQLRIAETEKYAHVTYFFDGGVEKDLKGMNKILIPSKKTEAYDLVPEMSAREITNTLIKELDKDIHDVIILNFANGDIVGHTGNYEASVKAVEYLDKCLSKLYGKILSKDGTLIITADHGNCDIMIDSNNNPVTSHTTSKVPFIITKKDIRLENGKLSNISPTILDLLSLEKPLEMEEESLIKKD